MSLNPIHTTEAIKEAYIRYLTTTFRIKEPELLNQFREILQEPGKFVKGPILEVTPSFLNGASIQDLVSEGVLSSQFLALNSEELPVDRPLYQHQDEAIRRLVEYRRNIVVATGTGSGKTETFMIPIIDHLLKEKTAGKLGPGIRALLLYPMNALANDQMKRLRLLLANMPDLTFGRYTGETEEKNRRRH
ncbi:MAG: DEAD/DEAH box helicase [Syntrophomonadales bacterium]